jgi:phenylacetate-CoA ligase
LKELWGVEPIDLYGANEVGHIAFQCAQRNGYHINVDSLHVELIRGGKPVGSGERGEVVVTNFDLRVMPIIRYRVGDVAQFLEDSCPCGCRFPLLRGIAGRSDGFIIGTGGGTFSALEVSLLLKEITGVKQFRLIQEKSNEVIVEIVKAVPTAHPEEGIRRLLKKRLGSEMNIVLREVPDIPREKSGKIRSVISKLPHPFWKQPDNPV